jgi:hypothetical protein
MMLVRSQHQEVSMRAVVVLLGLSALIVADPLHAQGRPGTYIPTGPNGYIYYAPQAWAAPPPYYAPYYGYGGYGPGYWASPRRLQPMGFGSPYYNGYNDPYYPTYGPGVREFIDFGGADFYGW